MPVTPTPEKQEELALKMPEAFRWLVDVMLKQPAEASRRVLHDVGTAIGVNKDRPEADIWDVAEVGAMLLPVSASPIASGARKGIGRVVTNVVEPFGYSPRVGASQARAMAKHEPREAIGKLVRDEPLYSRGDTAFRRQGEQAREVAYREMFDLEPRLGKSQLRQTGPKQYALRDVGVETSSYGKSTKYPSARKVVEQQIEEGLMSTSHEWQHGHTVMGGYDVVYRGKTSAGKLKFDYTDVWDFKMNPGERKEFMQRIFGKGDDMVAGYAEGMSRTSATVAWLGREILDKDTKPVTFKGRILIDPQRVARKMKDVPDATGTSLRDWPREFDEDQLAFLKNMMTEAIATR